MKKNNNSKWILISIIAIIIIIMIITIVLNSIKKTDSSTDINIDSEVETETKPVDEELMRKLKDSSEAERIKIYLGTYFRYLENKEYEKAYGLLYQEFKNNYFPTIEEFEKYIKEQEYPDMFAIEYEDIKIQGGYYVVKVLIRSFIPNTNNMQREITLIIKENNYNDYYISFAK